MEVALERETGETVMIKAAILGDLTVIHKLITSRKHNNQSAPKSISNHSFNLDKADAKERTAEKDSVMEQKTGKMIYASERAVELLTESAFSFAVNMSLLISPSAFDY